MRIDVMNAEFIKSSIMSNSIKAGASLRAAKTQAEEGARAYSEKGAGNLGGIKSLVDKHVKIAKKASR